MILSLRWLVKLVVLVGLTAAGYSWAATRFAPARAATAEQVRWYSFEEVARLQNTAPKKVFVDVYTDWCGWCKRMDRDTFDDPQVVAYLNAHYYAIKFDAEGKKAVDFGGRTYERKAGERTHALAVALLGNRLSYPSTVWLDEQGQVIQPIPGYLPPADFLKIASYFAGDHHLTTPWEAYQSGR